jgi:hypothetical protein
MGSCCAWRFFLWTAFIQLEAAVSGELQHILWELSGAAVCSVTASDIELLRVAWSHCVWHKTLCGGMVLLCARRPLWQAKISWLFDIPTRLLLIQGDNKGAIDAISSFSYTKHTKYIDIYHDFLREKHASGNLKFVHIAGSDNHAYVFTKAVKGTEFKSYVAWLAWLSYRINHVWGQ